MSFSYLADLCLRPRFATMRGNMPAIVLTLRTLDAIFREGSPELSDVSQTTMLPTRARKNAEVYAASVPLLYISVRAKSVQCWAVKSITKGALSRTSTLNTLIVFPHDERRLIVNVIWYAPETVADK